MIEEKDGGLTAEENAYFESEGETSFEAPVAEAKPAEGAAEATQDVAEEDKIEGPIRDDKGKFVPHGAFHAEREERRKAQAELAEVRERQARLEALWQSAQPKEEEPEIPEVDNDPIAALAWAVKTVRDQQEEAKRQAQEFQQRSQQEDQVRQVVEYVDKDFASAVEQDPSVNDAYITAFNSYAKELEALGYGGQQLQQEMARTLRNFQLTAYQRLQAGVPLGDFIKQVAATRGWQAKAFDPATAELSDGLKKVEKAQDASRTIGKVAGKAGGDPITIDDLSKMPQDEFNEWIAVPANEKRFQKLMGG